MIKFIDLSEKKLSPEEREKLPDSVFGLIQYKDGKKIRRYPMPDKQHVIAAWFLLKRGKNMTPKEREQLKKNILKRAKELGIDTTNWKK